MSRTTKRAFYSVVYLAFLAVSAWATMEVGYFGIFAAAAEGPGSIQVFFDLVVACILGSAWLHRHATERGRNPWPWLLAVPALGSIPLMTYAVGSLWLPSARPESLPQGTATA